MYSCREIDETTFQNFADTAYNRYYLQSIEEYQFQKAWDNAPVLLGVYDGDTLAAAGLTVYFPSRFGYKRAYMPCGYLADFTDEAKIAGITKALKEYFKGKKVLDLIIDPRIIYAEHPVYHEDQTDLVHPEILDLLQRNGYIHFGFNKNFESIQLRYAPRIEMKETYEETLRTFTKSTRKHLEALAESGIQIRKAEYEDLPEVLRLFEASGKEDHFEVSDLHYYQLKYRYMPKVSVFYLAYLDFPYYLAQMNKNLEKEKAALAETEKIMEQGHIGNKLKARYETATAHIKQYESYIEEAEGLRKQHGDILNIGALYAVRNYDEYITVASGMIHSLRHLNPKYALYNAVIRDAFKEKIPYINFYGVSGDFSKDNPLYGIYEFKRGFNGKVAEYLGQFSLPVSPLYHVYHALKKQG